MLTYYNGMQPNMVEKKSPPKHDIANGFVIGCFPSEITFTNKDGSKTTRDIKEEDLTDIMQAMLAPVRPYGYIFAWTAGSQEQLRGHIQFFLGWIKS